MREAVAGVAVDGPRLLIARRIGKSAGMWEFPGGAVEPGESHPAALSREFMEELSLRIKVHQRLNFVYKIGEILLTFWIVEPVHQKVNPGNSHDEIRWATLNEIEDLPLLEADEAALPAIREWLEIQSTF